MNPLQGKIVWITGAGTGIGAAAARALAESGAQVVLTGRRRDKLEEVAATIGASAAVEPGDLTDSAAAGAIVARIVEKFGRIDLLVANAGVNVRKRSWADLTPEAMDYLVKGNLTSVFYCVGAVLPGMRERKEGQIIVTASVAGRFIGNVSGPGYTAAKHGVVALCHTVNMEECVNGIRCSAVLPGEVATPILDLRPVPATADERARMAQPEDVADLIRYIATLPPRVVINEAMICPSWNRGYIAALQRKV